MPFPRESGLGDGLRLKYAASPMDVNRRVVFFLQICSRLLQILLSPLLTTGWGAFADD